MSDSKNHPVFDSEEQKAPTCISRTLSMCLVIFHTVINARMWSKISLFLVSHRRRVIFFLLKRSDLGRKQAAYLHKLRFFVNRHLYQQEERIYATRAASMASRVIFSFAVSPLVYAMLALVILMVLDRLGSTVMVIIGMPPILVEDNLYSVLLAVIAGAMGGMLALFFTSVSLVTATVYARVSNDVRDIIIEDDYNCRYLRLIAHIAAVAILGLAVAAFNSPPILTLLLYVSLLSIIVVTVFFPLGARTFSLFDPGVLVNSPIRIFLRSIRTVTHRGRRWLDPSFQNHARELSELQLLRLESLVSLSINELSPRTDSVVLLVKSFHKMVQFYEAKKSQIPSESFWYPRRAEFKRWHTSGGTTTDMSLRAGVSLFPDSVADCSYIERRCAELTARCLDHCLKLNKYDDAITILMCVQQTASVYARLYSTSYSIDLVEEIKTPLLHLLLR